MESTMLITEMSAALDEHQIPQFIREPDIIQWLNGSLFSNHKDLQIFLNDEEIILKCNEVYWSYASLQLSLGDLLIINESLDNESEILNSILIQHRVNIIYEQIYRVWERYTGLMAYLFFNITSKQNFYFNNLISEFNQHKTMITGYKKISSYNSLWNNLGSERNTISHQQASLTKSIQITTKTSSILDHAGQPIISAKKTITDKLENLKKITEYVNQVYNLNEVIQKFIVENKDLINNLSTSFPWIDCSVKQPKEDKKYLVYKTGEYFILNKNEFSPKDESLPSTEKIFWKELELHPKADLKLKT